MKTITLTEEQLDKLITHVESMIECCDDPTEQQFYQDWLDQVSK